MKSDDPGRVKGMIAPSSHLGNPYSQPGYSGPGHSGIFLYPPFNFPATLMTSETNQADPSANRPAMTRPRSELLAVLLTGLAHFALDGWLGLRLVFIVGTCLFWVGFVVVRARADAAVLAEWGFSGSGFRRSLEPLIPALVLAALCFVGIGLWRGDLLLHGHIVLVGLLYPAWGLVQQFLIVALIANNLRKQTRIPERWLVLLTASLFAAAHAPSLPLAAAAFCLASITTTVYFRARNLWVLGLFHGWFATGLYFFALGRDPWQEVVLARLWP